MWICFHLVPKPINLIDCSFWAIELPIIAFYILIIFFCFYSFISIFNSFFFKFIVLKCRLWFSFKCTPWLLFDAECFFAFLVGGILRGKSCSKTILRIVHRSKAFFEAKNFSVSGEETEEKENNRFSWRDLYHIFRYL